jgi:UDP-N-acetyl-D-glucosamine dehydrogenase
MAMRFYEGAQMDAFESSLGQFKTRRAVIGVIGLGYAGLPVALAFAEAGFTVVGLDIDSAKVEALSQGHSYLAHFSSRRLKSLLEAAKFKVSCDFGGLQGCDAAIICVPTPLDETHAPDLSDVMTTTQSVARYLHRGQLVVLESTSYPGTTSEVVLPLLSRTGLKVGEDFFLAFSPERQDPGNDDFDVTTIPKLVGGITERCRILACAAYGEVVSRIVPVSSARVAEASKLLENTFRCVNIAMINELKTVFARMGIDVWEVIEAAATKPFGFVPFFPGPGLGGHCIPIDPFYLSWKARQFGATPRLIELAGEINASMPEYVLTRLIEGLESQGKMLKGSNILLLGVAYKRDIEDVRESPALAVINLLNARGATARYYDPHVPVLRSRHLEAQMSSVDLTAENLAAAEAVVIITDHRKIDYRWVLQHARLVVDTRNATKYCRSPGDHIIDA